MTLEIIELAEEDFGRYLCNAMHGAYREFEIYGKCVLSLFIYQMNAVIQVVQIIVCRVVGAKPSSKPMLEYHELDP